MAGIAAAGARASWQCKKDNFWEMGDTGSVRAVQRGSRRPDAGQERRAELVNAGDARVIEIWNLVFIQFNRGPGRQADTACRTSTSTRA